MAKSLSPIRFEAWVHGPVARDLYIRFADYKWQPITSEIKCPELTKDVTEHLDEIYKVFGGFSAYELEQMTHQESPGYWLAQGFHQMPRVEMISTKASLLNFTAA
jgi:uncharacterized phage-associated protein